MRIIEDHKVNPANDTLTLAAIDEPGSGGANHLYMVTGFNSQSNPSCPWQAAHGAPAVHSRILFQNGPIAEAGVNGLTHEVLLAILADRLRGFQAGPYHSADNAEALACIEQAQAALQRRTRSRMARGVEGTHQV